MRIGVLALQGAFIEHEQILKKLGAECAELRKSSDLDKEMDGIVLPGGESTVQGKLLAELGMLERIKRKIQQGLPVLATCAGLILLAEYVSVQKEGGKTDLAEYASAQTKIGEAALAELRSGKGRACFATLPVTVRRNAYGRQLGSFSASANIRGLREEERPFPLEFIRAPYIESVWGEEAVEPIAVIEKLPDGSRGKNIVGVRYQNQIGLAFHPELVGDTRCHEMFLSMCHA